MIAKRANFLYRFTNEAPFFVAEILFLCFPAFINQAPLVYPDTRSYFMGGRAAIDKLTSLFSHVAATGVETQIQKARGVRSAFYALFVYVPTVTISLWVVIILQAAIVAALLGLAFRLVCADLDRWQTTIFIAMLSLFTTLAWVTSNVMPDVFTSVMALSIALTIVYWNELGSHLGASRWPRRPVGILLSLAIGGSMVMHLSNLLIALGLLGTGMALFYTALGQNWRRYLFVFGSLIAGVAALVVVGVVGFHQWSPAPQAPPFLLARSLRDGPGRLYLLEHCPQAGLEMCKHLDKLELPTEQFLWASDGVYSAVSPAEEASLRAEDKHIYIAAALEHPGLQITAIFLNTLQQLTTFSFREYMIPSRATYTSDDMTMSLPPEANWQRVLSIADYIIVTGCLLFIGLAWRRVPTPLKQLSVMNAATVVLEAMAGAISEPVPRYEARVIWLVPMTALLIWTVTHEKRPVQSMLKVRV